MAEPIERVEYDLLEIARRVAHYERRAADGRLALRDFKLLRDSVLAEHAKRMDDVARRIEGAVEELRAREELLETALGELRRFLLDALNG